jgi:hypothetical protein
MGDSVGHYEGDTLVIDTVGVAVGPKNIAMIDRYGTPRSSALHVVERYRLIDGKIAKEAAERQMRDDGPRFNAAVLVDPAHTGPGLQLTFTVEDPGVFTTPWSAVVTYRRAGNSWQEQVCAESLQDYKLMAGTGLRREFAGLLRRTRALFAGRGEAGFLRRPGE